MTKISISNTNLSMKNKILRNFALDIKTEFEKLNIRIRTYNVIDNASTDNTIKILQEICLKDDKNVKVIVNSKNYGHIRSPFYGILQSTGDACILNGIRFSGS